MNEFTCKTLAARFESKRENGLVDVKFLLSNAQEAAVEEVCAEVEAFYAAMENGRATPLDFGDRAWNENRIG